MKINNSVEISSSYEVKTSRINYKMEECLCRLEQEDSERFHCNGSVRLV
jgi:hypothetical protein